MDSATQPNDTEPKSDLNVQSESETNESTNENGEGDTVNQIQVDDVENEGPKSSASNIIPLDKIKNGWAAWSGYVATTVTKVKERAVETYNSEQVANIKRRTSEVITPAWEKTCEVAAPIWESTCTSASLAKERAQQSTNAVRICLI